MKSVRWAAAVAASIMCLTCATTRAAIIPVVEDVMTSAFFQGTDLVRGYAGDNRPTFRVSSNNAFGSGPETIYMTFDPSQFEAYSGPVPQAFLTVQSVPGGFGADASPTNPLAVSAHAVSANPLTSITDNTNPGGTINWLDFFNNNILPAAPAATTVISGVGAVQFDITSLVNDWISGSNTIFSLALTAKNDTLSDGNVLTGIRNNTETPGSTFITVVPEPASILLIAAAFAIVGCTRRIGRNL